MQAAVYRAANSTTRGTPVDGYTLIEALFAMTMAAMLAAMAIPQTSTSIDRSRAWSAARYLSSRMALARMQAVGRSASVALRFAEGGDGFAFDTFVDGNRNGVRAHDIAAGVDRRLDPPVQLSDLFPGVVIGTAAGTLDDPVQIGSSNLLSFTPNGTSSSGTIYIRGRDGSRFAVRVLGATGRTRVLRYVAVTGQWSEVP
jgi:type II secretory pathway pseudopilin PulG